MSTTFASPFSQGQQYRILNVTARRCPQDPSRFRWMVRETDGLLVATGCHKLRHRGRSFPLGRRCGGRDPTRGAEQVRRAPRRHTVPLSPGSRRGFSFAQIFPILRNCLASPKCAPATHGDGPSVGTRLNPSPAPLMGVHPVRFRVPTPVVELSMGTVLALLTEALVGLGVTNYRAFGIAATGEVVRRYDFVSSNDAAALEHARRLVEQCDLRRDRKRYIRTCGILIRFGRRLDPPERCRATHLGQGGRYSGLH